MKKFIGIFLLIILLILFQTGSEHYLNYKSQMITLKKEVYTPLTLFSGNKYSFYSNYSNVLTNIFPIININSSGSYSNILNLIYKKADFVISQHDIAQDSYMGIGKFHNPYKDLRIIKSISNEKITLICRSELFMNSWKDIRDKKICVGLKTSGSAYIFNELVKIFNFDIGKLDIIYEHQFSNDTENKFRNKEIDCIFSVCEHPNIFILKLSSKLNIKILGTEGINRYNIKSRFPNWYRDKIPLSYYGSNILSTQINVPTFSMNTVLFTHKNIDTMSVYRMIQTLYKKKVYILNKIGNFSENIHNLNRQVLEIFPISSEFIENNIIPLHQGVKKFYLDIGLITYNPNKKCALFAGSGKCNLELVKDTSNF